MKILFTSPILEHPAAGGPQLRIENSIKALSLENELDIITTFHASYPVTEETAKFFKSYCHKFISLPDFYSKYRKNFFIRKIFRVMTYLFNFQSAKEAEYILDYVSKRDINVIWFGYGNISWALIKKIKKHRPDIKLICDTDSVWSRFVLRELPYINGFRKFKTWMIGKLKEKEEKAWVNLCEITTAVSEVDAAYYRSLTTMKDKVQVFSNVIDLETYKDFKGEYLANKPSIFLAGSFGDHSSSMNVAATWVIDEVLPLLLKKIPDLHFYIVGRNSDIGFGHLSGQNITVTGKVESVLPYLMNTSVALVPLKFESGTRFKILEAGACKIPIVSTTLGAEGIPVTHEHDIVIADTPEDFANGIIKIITDEKFSQKLSENCFDLVFKNYSIDTLKRESKSILEKLK